jgi:hypothetical protein
MTDKMNRNKKIYNKPCDNDPASITKWPSPRFVYQPQADMNSDAAINASLKTTSTLAPLDSPYDTISTAVVDDITKMDTTTFVDNKLINTNDTSKMTHIDEAINVLTDSQLHTDSLMDFLTKPVLLDTGTFNTSDSFSIFNSFSMPYSVLNSTPGMIWKQKLAGFFGMRMDMRFKIVVNANKFQQGRYIMSWTPTGGASPNISNLKNFNFVHAHNASITQRTTLPHVELDINHDTSAELLIPFASVNAFYPLNPLIAGSDYGGLGYLNIYPYSPLVAASGSTSCGYSLYVSFENVRLFGAAAAQAGAGISRKEVANKNQGPISGIASSISRGFNEFSNIPLIGSFAKDVSWISDRIASTASIFGFSKPTAGDNCAKMQLVNTPNHSTVDGDSDARALSFLSCPGIVPLKGLSGTEYDEMDFSFIKSIYANLGFTTWTDIDSHSTVLSITEIRPSTGELSVVVGGKTYFNYIPFSFLARQFKNWRGSIKLRYKIVKTEFHSGRLQFAFYPGDEFTYIATESYVNRVIVDIREKSVVELTIPFIARTPWVDYRTSIGRLIVTVVDPLVAPATVSSSVAIILEMAGGADFEVSVPDYFYPTPSVYVPQADLSVDSNTIISTVIGGAAVNSDPLIMSSSCIGDKISSLRAMAKRFYPYQIVGTVVNTNSKGISVNPDAIMFNRTDTRTNFETADFISVWGSCYMFMSGGLRLRNNLDFGLTDLSQKTVHASAVSFLLSGKVNTTELISTYTPGGGVGNNHKVIHDVSTNNTVTVEVPQYTRTFTRSVLDLAIFQSDSTGSSVDYIDGYSGTIGSVSFFVPQQLTVTPQVGYSLHNIYRAGADDFNLSLFISIPPMRWDITVNRPDVY